MHKKVITVKRLMLVLLFCFIIGVNLFAEEKSFCGDGVENLWNDPDCWNPPGVPDIDDNVTIPEGITCNFELAPHEGLTSINDITINGTLNFGCYDNTLNVRGDLENNGSILSIVNQLLSFGRPNPVVAHFPS